MPFQLRPVRGLAGILIVTTAVSACGGSDAPAAPAPVFANVAGTWTGTFQSTQNDSNTGLPVQGAQAVSLTMTQNGSTVTGTWTTTAAATPRSGSIAGTTTAAAFSGTFSYNSTSVNGTPCTGTLAVSGPAGGVALTWTSPAIVENCTNAPTNITITVIKS